MTTAARATTPIALMVRAAALPSLGVGLLVALLAATSDGWRGFSSAMLGCLLAGAFFATGQLVLHLLRSVSPVMLLVIALLTYVLQVVVLLAIYAGYAGAAGAGSDTGLSATAFGVAIIASTGAWIVGLVVAARRERIPLYQLGDQR